MKKSAYLRVERWARNGKLEGSNSSFCKDIKLKMVADAKGRRLGFITYVKESLSFNSSMF